MKIEDIIRETYTALSANKVRSSLTILGIVIGISSVIAMVSIGTGASSSISSRIESLGSNLIQVMPGAQRTQGFGASSGRGSAKTLTTEDGEAITSGVEGIAAIDFQLSNRYQVTAKGTNTNTTVMGVTPAYTTVKSLNVAEGSFISDTQDKLGSKVAVLGPSARDDLFGEDADAIGEVIRIDGKQFKVIGITETKGGSGMTNQDDMIFIPLKTMQRYLTGGSYLSTIAIQASSQEGMDQVQADVTSLLLARHKLASEDDADFTVMNQTDILSSATEITSTLTYLLAAIGGISLLVGGIGIMNMMLTTVTERTKEIGLRKAIGARRRDISTQFLAEAVALTVIGGVIGIALGWSISYIINLTGIVSTSVSLTSVILAFGVAAATGIIFGYYPARKASRMSPIDALRYE